MSKNAVAQFTSAAKATFRASDEMKRFKASLLVRVSESPFLSLETMSKSDMLAIVGTTKLDDWMSQDGFEQWLRNGREHQERLEYLYTLALDGIEELILSTNEKTQGARVKAMDLLIKLADKMPRSHSENPAIGAIAGMDKMQLESYLSKSGYSVKQTFEVKKEAKALEAITVEAERGKD